MFIYWIIFTIPALVALSTTKVHRQVSTLGWFLLGIFFVLIIGLRFEVGIDWPNLIYSFKYALVINGVDIKTTDVLLSEAIPKGALGYGVMCWIIANLGGEIYAVHLIVAITFMSGLIAFCCRQPNPWLALVVAIPMLVIIIGMNYNRQALAIGFIFFALISLMDGKVWRFVFFVLLGGLFHATAVIFIILGVVSRKIDPLRNKSDAVTRALKRIWTLTWMLAIGFALYFFILQDILRILFSYYFGIKMYSGGALPRVLMNAVPAVIFLLFHKRLQLTIIEKHIWFLMALASIGCLVALPLLPSTSAVDRVAMYLIPIQLVVYSRLPLLFTPGFSMQTVKAFIILGYALIQFVYLNFGTHASGWLPYKFYPLEVL
jgi:hypothetical protein